MTLPPQLQQRIKEMAEGAADDLLACKCMDVFELCQSRLTALATELLLEQEKLKESFREATIELAPLFRGYHKPEFWLNGDGEKIVETTVNKIRSRHPELFEEKES